ncbi:SRPBCC family protein [[Mycobacterium] nativiensis]|uniref:SRPBCC family protein n=1 Tax=[Mycobacterium] nativiensis TaxID=2855503 RepID=A0ABU5XV61_9MYCO|nr:SRPBCC family protein [Mycolicibacter sp. MYC340]MEB3031617.1 SRPBCC family protein [Mycolicibacter sp. MYC340]
MAHRFECVIRRRSAASPQTLFAIVSDGARWSQWAAPLIPYSTWECLDPDGDVGVGAIRAVGRRKRPTREMITIHEPDSRHGYTMLIDGPIQDYQGEVTFAEDADGTRITWRGRYETRWRAVGMAYWLVLRAVLGTLARKLVAAGERTAG